MSKTERQVMDTEDGHWITINADKDKGKKGSKVFIKKGETLNQAIERQWGKKGKEPKKEPKKEVKLPELQRKLSNGQWNTLSKENLDKYITSFLRKQKWISENIKGRETIHTKEEAIDALTGGKKLQYGDDWYALIRAKPKPKDPRLGELSYLKEQYWELDAEIMEGEEPSVPSKFNETRHAEKAKLKKEIKKLAKELDIDAFPFYEKNETWKGHACCGRQ